MKTSEKFIKNIIEQEDVYGPDFDETEIERKPGLIRKGLSGIGRGVSSVSRGITNTGKNLYTSYMSEPEPVSDYDIIGSVKNIAKQVFPGGPVGSALIRLAGKNIIEPTAKGLVRVKRALIPAKEDNYYE